MLNKRNLTKKEQFDIVIVGSGASPIFYATKLNQAGKTVAIIGEHIYGGTCPCEDTREVAGS